mgnify:CR=1 FL=1
MRIIQPKFYSVKKILFFSVLSLSFVLGSCSSDDNEEIGGGGTTSPYWTLGSGNANMPSSGTIIAQYSDAPAGSEISKLVDANADTKYVTYHNAFDITWNGNSNIAVLAYSLTSAADAPEMDPKSWVLSGSLDNKVWKTIDSQDNQTFTGRKEVKSFEVENSVAYRYYKLSIQSNRGGNATQIAEWVLSAATFTGNIDDLLPYSSGNTYTADTPMGTQHKGGRVATTADIAWLKDATKEPVTFAGLSWATFPVGSLYPFGDPKPADVNQHVIGDCSACAVMAAMAHYYPKFIKKIIKDNGNSTFTVSLYDPKGKEIEVGVSNMFVADGSKLGAVSGKNDQVTWATVLEKSLIKWKQIYAGTSDIGGIATEYAASIFTGNGNSFAFASGKLSAKELKRAVIVSLQQGKLVIGGFKDGDLPVENKYKTVNFHAYSFYPSSNDAVLFTMRNPWGMLPLVSGGYSNGKEDGLLNIKDDGVIPPNVDIRVMEPGAAKAYANAGNIEPYTPPSYLPAPMRVAEYLLRTGR